MKASLLTLLAFVSLSFLPAEAQVAWPYEYLRGDYEVPCLDKQDEMCIWHRLLVDNPTTDTLECYGRIVFDKPNREGKTEVRHKAVIDPTTRRAVIGDMTATTVKAVDGGVECAIRRPYDDSKLTMNCKATWTQKPETIDYPPESRTAGEEGPVQIELTLTDKEGPPTDVAVVGTSLWPKLDASAVKYVMQHRGRTDCKQGRFRMPVTFRLR